MTMSTTSVTATMTPDSEAYLAAVRDELDDLPEEERADLLEDLALHLAELSSSANRDDEAASLDSRLGPPGRYAAELRSAAGLPPRLTSRPAGTPHPSAPDGAGRGGRLFDEGDGEAVQNAATSGSAGCDSGGIADAVVGLVRQD